MSDHSFSTTEKFGFHTGFVELDCTIHFTVAHWGSSGSRDEPPSGPEFEIETVWIDEIDDTISFTTLDALTQFILEEAVSQYINSGELQQDMAGEA